MRRLADLLLFTCAFVLPWPARRFLYRRLRGFELHPEARIGAALVAVGRCSMGPRARIGHFTVIRNLDRLDLGDGAKIGTFNWIFGMPGGSDAHFLDHPERDPALVMERESSLTSRHIVDCTDRVSIGAFTTVAGFRSQILTHSIDIEDSTQRARPVVIGEYCMIGSGCIILKGARVPRGTVLGAGSVFRGTPPGEYQLMSGVPAAVVRPLGEEQAYFRRTAGPVA
jgi:acetyltransferase-like isoleucine patch superfamily enzyme